VCDCDGDCNGGYQGCRRRGKRRRRLCLALTTIIDRH
jgi:hypothetical protein